VTADPQGAASCAAGARAGLTLDPSHYHTGPHAKGEYDCLFKFVRHVRLRDTGRAADQFQVRIGQGELEFGKVVSQLDRFRYDRR
jgi:sugar phosphate isomerase/epimerase